MVIGGADWDHTGNTPHPGVATTGRTRHLLLCQWSTSSNRAPGPIKVDSDGYGLESSVQSRRGGSRLRLVCAPVSGRRLNAPGMVAEDARIMFEFPASGAFLPGYSQVEHYWLHGRMFGPARTGTVGRLRTTSAANRRSVDEGLAERCEGATALQLEKSWNQLGGTLV